MNKLIIFSAPSGSGKTTIVKHLLSLENLNLAFSISATSRAPRGVEQDGRDVAGGLRLKKKYPDQTLAIFVEPPSLVALEERLRNRKTETEEKIQMRLNKAEQEMATAHQFDVIIKNDDLQQALQEAERIVTEFINR